MNTKFLRRLAIAFLPFALFLNCYLINATASSKRPKSSSNTRAEKNTKRDRATSTGKARINQNSKDKRSSAVPTRGGRQKVDPKRSIAENDSRRQAGRNTSNVNAKVEKSSKREVAPRESKRAKNQRIAELRKAEALRAEAARLAAIAHERARNEALRQHVQSLILKDDLTGEDPEIRRIAVKALGNHAGTVVVMNPQTGRVYSIVNQEWALREGFKPCSTIKLVTSLAGLNENVIDPNNSAKISDSNQVSLTRALAFSKNHYFQVVGEQVGLDKMLTYARRMGLGEKTGINARNEFQGRVPGSKSFSAIHRISSHGDHYEVTALQLATLVSAIGNGGKLLTPYIVRTRQDEMKLKTKVRRQVNVNSEVWRHLLPGMAGAVNYGSGRRAQDPAQQVAGKTGTCIEQGNWVGLFTSYAPIANPKFAVVVIARGADAHSHFPAAVAGKIYRDLSIREGAPASVQLASSRDKSLDREPLEADEEEATALAEEPEFKVETTTVFRGDRNNPSRVKPVLMSIPVPRQVIKPSAVNDDEPAITSGQTRPRRVLGE